MDNNRPKKTVILWVGDVVTLGVVTLVGFASHDELGTAGLRILTTFLPLLVAWFLVSVPAGIFETKAARDKRLLWRPVWAMAIAGPLAILLRGLWLSRPIIPLFAVVLTGVSMLAILLWRVIYIFVFTPRR